MPEISTDLQTWLSGSEWLEEISVIDDVDFETVTVQAKGALAAAPAVFFRLRLILSPPSS